MEFMLETICDIKNNKKRPKEETMQLTRIKKWLQKVCIYCYAAEKSDLVHWIQFSTSFAMHEIFMLT